MISKKAGELKLAVTRDQSWIFDVSVREDDERLSPAVQLRSSITEGKRIDGVIFEAIR